MENQPNADNQNAQQIGQNPISHPPVTPVPEKPKVNYWMISTIILLVLFFGFVGWYFLSTSKQGKETGGNNSRVPGLIPTETADIQPNVKTQQGSGKVAYRMTGTVRYMDK